MSMTKQGIRDDIERRQQLRFLQRSTPAPTQTANPERVAILAQMGPRPRTLGQALGLKAPPAASSSAQAQGDGQSQLSRPNDPSFHSPLPTGGIAMPQMNKRAKGMTL